MKQCSECQIIISNNRKYCNNTCRSRFYRKHTKFNKDYMKSKKQEWYLANKETELVKIKAYQITNKHHIAKTHNEYLKNKKQMDPSFKMACNLRSRISKFVSGTIKQGSAIKDLGCHQKEFKVYLESKFQPGMTWDNYGFYGWHIDHIKPLSRFDLTDREQAKDACHYTNLQPLWAKDNLRKGNR